MPTILLGLGTRHVGVGDEKSMLFEKSPGPLRRMASKAAANPNESFVLIIDEINRGNLAKVFGELYFLLEYRDKSVELMYSSGEKFKLPENLLILGTMNTADKSITSIDTALRRRFSFKEFAPEDKLLEGKKIGFGKESVNLQIVFQTLNSRLQLLLGTDFLLGHSYFLKINDREDLCRLFYSEIIPLLRSYFYDDFGKIALVLGDIDEIGKLDSEKFIISKTVDAGKIFGTSSIEEEDQVVYEINPLLCEGKHSDFSVESFKKGFGA
jgi:5-methylcytosine-specific restriction protein B